MAKGTRWVSQQQNVWSPWAVFKKLGCCFFLCSSLGFSVTGRERWRCARVWALFGSTHDSGVAAAALTQTALRLWTIIARATLISVLCCMVDKMSLDTRKSNEFATTNVKRHFVCDTRNFLILSRFLPMSMFVNPGGLTKLATLRSEREGNKK